MRRTQYRILLKITLAAMFLALGYVLPFFTGNIPEIGQKLLPMHLPVMLCGMICGWQYGAAVGFTLPLLRSLTVGKPMIYPQAAGMAVELLTYGLVIGIVYGMFKKKTPVAGYTALLVSMAAGRAAWGVARVIMAGVSDSSFAFKAFLTGAFTDALPGIVVQILLIPPVMLLIEKSGVMKKIRE